MEGAVLFPLPWCEDIRLISLSTSVGPGEPVNFFPEFRAARQAFGVPAEMLAHLPHADILSRQGHHVPQMAEHDALRSSSVGAAGRTPVTRYCLASRKIQG